jgi:hypothetical protein
VKPAHDWVKDLQRIKLQLETSKPVKMSREQEAELLAKYAEQLGRDRKGTRRHV